VSAIEARLVVNLRLDELEERATKTLECVGARIDSSSGLEVGVELSLDEALVDKVITDDPRLVPPAFQQLFIRHSG